SLFTAAWQTLCQFGNDKIKALEVQLGMIAVLHTWGQNMSLHPHLHCIVPGGGITANGNWKNVRKDGKFLFSVKAMSKVFRAKYMAELSSKIELEKSLRQTLFNKSWVIFAKRPFGSPKSVIEYLGRYTHKIAISNHRIQSIDDEGVVFQFKDYKDG
ncbi:MAG: transposase, partial [Dolichospermum sp.]